MLLGITKKICPFLTLAFATIGCGKNINDGKSSIVQSVKTELSPRFVLDFSSLEGLTKSFKVPQDGRFYIPKTVKVTAGNGIGKRMSISYNYDADTKDYEFRCKYSSLASATELTLQTCYDSHDRELSQDDINLNTFFIDLGFFIRIELLTPTDSTLEVEFIHDITWT